MAAPARCGPPRKADAKGDNSLFRGGLATFHDFRTGFVKCFRKRFTVTATGIASDNTFNKPDAKVKDKEEAKGCEYEEKRAAFHRATAAIKSLPSKICAWKISHNTFRLRLDFSRKLEDAVCAHQDWLDAIEAMNNLKYESAEQSEQGDKGFHTGGSRGCSWALGCMTRSPSFWLTAKALKLMGSTIFASLAMLFLSRTRGLRGGYAALCFSVLGGSLGFRFFDF